MLKAHRAFSVSKACDERIFKFKNASPAARTLIDWLFSPAVSCAAKRPFCNSILSSRASTWTDGDG